MTIGQSCLPSILVGFAIKSGSVKNLAYSSLWQPMTVCVARWPSG